MKPRQCCWIVVPLVAMLSVACHARTQPTRAPTSSPTITEAAPIIHAAAAPALTLTPTATPTRTQASLPSSTPSITPVWTATQTAPAIPTRSATNTPTAHRPSASPTNTQPASELTPQTLTRTIQITGAMEALQRDGKGRWEAIGIECLDTRGQIIARLPVLAWQEVYALPLNTRQVRLWIGAELGGETWWREWGAQPVSAADNPILLRIGRPDSALAPTGAPTAPPTVIPTAAPTAIATAAPTAIPTAVPTYTSG